MTVKELIAELSRLEQDRIVVMSKDSEGNSYSPLADIGRSAYIAETTWNGSIGIEKLTAKLKAKGYTKEDVISDGQPAVVLWPTN